MSVDQRMREFIRGIPKAELHLHIEGTLEPEMLLELAERNKVTLPCKTAEECRAQYHFNDLQHFLDLYYEGVDVLVTEQDFYELTEAYLRRVHADGARHVEIFFDPQSHLPRGVRFPVFIEGIRAALVDAERLWGMSWRLIMCFLRDQSPASAMATLETARPYRHLISGVGLDSAEVGHPPRDVRGRVPRRQGGRLPRRGARRRGGAGRVHRGGARPAARGAHRPRRARHRRPRPARCAWRASACPSRCAR